MNQPSGGCLIKGRRLYKTLRDLSTPVASFFTAAQVSGQHNFASLDSTGELLFSTGCSTSRAASPPESASEEAESTQGDGHVNRQSLFLF